MRHQNTTSPARVILSDNEGGTVFKDPGEELVGVHFDRTVNFYSETEFLMFAGLVAAAAEKMRPRVPSVDCTILQMFPGQ